METLYSILQEEYGAEYKEEFALMWEWVKLLVEIPMCPTPQQLRDDEHPIKTPIYHNFV